MKESNEVIKGKRFGKLVVIEYDHSDKNKRYWKCKCDCGNTKVVFENYLKYGHSKSCGCGQKEGLAYGRILKRKPHRKTKLYGTWLNMKQRCTNPKLEHAKYYIGKGIQISDEWANSFDAFYSWAIQNGYKDGLTIDRIDNEKGYEPDNCRWVDIKAQCNNRTNNRIVNYNGEEHTIAEWCELLGFKYGKLYGRLERGWDIERAFTTP